MEKVQERLGSGGKKVCEKKGWEMMITAWERLEKVGKRLGKAKKIRKLARKGGNYWVGQGKAGIRLGKVWENRKSGKGWERHDKTWK